MSNKIVPTIYRTVIDEVIAAIKPEFDEYGVAEDVLAELQSKWESRVIASHVAEFETPAAAPPPPTQPVQSHQIAQTQQALHQAVQSHAYAQPVLQMPPMPHGTYAGLHNPYAAPGVGVKAEPLESRHLLSGSISPSTPQYTLPPLNPALAGRHLAAGGVLPPGYAAAAYQPMQPVAQARPPAQTQQTAGQSSSRIPQVDGPSYYDGSDDDEDDRAPGGSNGAQYPPRTSHPSVAAPQASGASTAGNGGGDEAINSDLDDSEEDLDEDVDQGTAGETDIVFCTYDKVARVKNKWKCVLKDGMVHVNGRDYLFAKCTGEFEW
ncbi:transcription factor IIA, alpha/beta subunit-domain-containing protein [Pterulicium gracile]|uniref:Transcription factor IIA, alpha/beta subunit-domain-containing protein n=1 Tax=Pterulicium gracile TaxID=1884261 RepID=A0A5C3QNY5_9AGAR|nr:transcription factor IIA, alpha/beta subunit-domain-containing protein [Pterula gracilis]